MESAQIGHEFLMRMEGLPRASFRVFLVTSSLANSMIQNSIDNKSKIPINLGILFIGSKFE